MSVSQGARSRAHSQCSNTDVCCCVAARAVLQENSRKRNGKYSPDSRDKFSFGRSLFLSHLATYRTLEALVDHLSADKPLFLLFHDSRSDIKSLAQLGLNVSLWQHGLARLDGRPGPRGARGAGVYVVDTQKLWAAFIGEKRQVGLGRCCELLGIGTADLHNAGNDAHFTLEIFERMMDRALKVPEGAVAPKP